ncbi:Profilin-1A [Smittium culicis]|uniref:Profilin n=1 Tax=Smittium culicis TaxID=133412 RepID=A0A1R1XHN2_9FUNG|nr:Profilin-1A [Smittium culicis]OMJ14130.1 Profilin-1A [Smittium culicis]OMJ20375.1 Profilin-1A [Smittium culicis]
MSWQTYVDSNLVGTGYVNQAAIYGLDGNPWAISSGFKISPEEFKGILASFTDPSTIRASGLYLSGIKYFALNCNERSVYGKKESTGVICVKAKTCVLIGTYGEHVQPGQATSVVEKLADYLIGVGYVRYSFYHIPIF